MSEEDSGRALREPALVCDQAPSGLDPSGFDPARVLMEQGAQRIEELRGERQRLFEALGVCIEALHTAKHGAEYDDELGDMIDEAIASAREARKPHL